MPSSLGPAEILVILVVALIVLGPKRLPEAGRQVGKALSEVRRWSQDVKYEMNQAFRTETRAETAAPPSTSEGAVTAPATPVDPAETVIPVEPPAAEVAPDADGQPLAEVDRTPAPTEASSDQRT